MIDIVTDIMSSPNKANMDMPGTGILDAPFGEGALNDALGFGFSYVEQKDHFVEYIVADPKIMKRIFSEIHDSEIGTDKDYIGNLWTAKLLVSRKVKENHLIFSNKNFSTVLDLSLDIDINNE